MLDILDRICCGEGKQGDLEELEQLAGTVKSASLCGLGRPRPTRCCPRCAISATNTRPTWQGRCPAGKCKALIVYRVTDECIGCTLCAQHCPVDAIPMTPYARHTIDLEKCTRCDTCRAGLPDRGDRGGMIHAA